MAPAATLSVRARPSCRHVAKAGWAWQPVPYQRRHWIPAASNPSVTAATTRYGLPHGPAALDLARHGDARELPLIRDDAATVLVGTARHLGADAKLHGESYVDDSRLFAGSVRGIRIEPTREAPGLRARVERRLRSGRWHIGRAAQTGGTNLVVEREGVVTERIVKRSTFYRHHVDWKLVCP